MYHFLIAIYSKNCYENMSCIRDATILQYIYVAIMLYTAIQYNTPDKKISICIAISIAFKVVRI